MSVTPEAGATGFGAPVPVRSMAWWRQKPSRLHWQAFWVVSVPAEAR